MNVRIVATAGLAFATLLGSGCAVGTTPGTAQASPAAVVGTVPVTTTGGAAPTASPVSGTKIVAEVRVIPSTLVVALDSLTDVTGSVKYTDGTFDSTIQWSSSDSTILTVNAATGKVSAIKAGIANVIASSTLDPSKKAMMTVTVNPAQVVEALASVTPATASLKKGETVPLKAAIKLSDGSESPNVKWKSSNQSVAIVTNGLVTAVGVGKAIITATANGDTTKEASAEITVTE